MTLQKQYSPDPQMSIQKACQHLGVSRSGYQDWLKRQSKQDAWEQELRMVMHQITIEFPYYGYPRMTKTLQRMGYRVNHKRIYRLMTEENLLCKRKKFKPITTQSNHAFKKYENLAKDITPTDINQLIVADITYIHLQEEFVYLAVIIDLFSRRCVGWELSRKADVQLTLNALDMAIALRGEKQMNGCIHHSDRGVQYAAHAYVQRLAEVGMRPSMSGKGNSYDNAFAESFIKTVKYDEVHMKEYRSFGEAFENIRNFIEEVYNKKRLHSGIKYMTPEEFEKIKK
jgi:putative transposase